MPTRIVRLMDVTLKAVPVRQSARHAPVQQQRERFELDIQELKKIRAEMPTRYHEWTGERAAVPRVSYYRKEQWLVEWMDYGHDRNAWELSQGPAGCSQRTCSSW